MQNKDFDQFIRNAAENFPAPEYNPADWDKLEDRLHSLNTPQAKPVTNPSAGAGFGKLAMVASAVAITAINALLFINNSTENSSVSAKKPVATEIQAVPQETINATAAENNTNAEITSEVSKENI